MKIAIPVSYLDPRSGIGSVSVVSSEGPPLSVKPWTQADGEDKSICIELENIIKTVEREMGLTDDEVMRLCLHLSDARKLTHNLIYALAQSGDRIATRLQIFLDDTMAQIRAMDESQLIDDSKQKDQLVGLCTVDLVNLHTKTMVIGAKISWPHPQNLPPKYNQSGLNHNTPSPLPPQNVLRLKNFEFDRTELQENLTLFIRTIRKYAMLLNLLIRMKDRNQIMNEIDCNKILHPYVAEDPIVL